MSSAGWNSSNSHEVEIASSIISAPYKGSGVNFTVGTTVRCKDLTGILWDGAKVGVYTAGFMNIRLLADTSDVYFQFSLTANNTITAAAALAEATDTLVLTDTHAFRLVKDVPFDYTLDFAKDKFLNVCTASSTAVVHLFRAGPLPVNVRGT